MKYPATVNGWNKSCWRMTIPDRIKNKLMGLNTEYDKPKLTKVLQKTRDVVGNEHGMELTQSIA